MQIVHRTTEMWSSYTPSIQTKHVCYPWVNQIWLISDVNRNEFSRFTWYFINSPQPHMHHHQPSVSHEADLFLYLHCELLKTSRSHPPAYLKGTEAGWQLLQLTLFPIKLQSSHLTELCCAAAASLPSLWLRDNVATKLLFHYHNQIRITWRWKYLRTAVRGSEDGAVEPTWLPSNTATSKHFWISSSDCSTCSASWC